MTQLGLKDVPTAAHTKAVAALDDFDRLVSEYELLLDTQQVLVRTANFAGLFELASHGDRLARDAANCGKRFAPLVAAVSEGQFAGPRAMEIRRRSLASRSLAETLGGCSSRLAENCRGARDLMARQVRLLSSSGSDAGFPSAYRADPQPLLDRRV